MNDGALGLAAIDYSIVIAYLLGVLVAGIYFGRFVRSPADLFLAGKGLPFWAIGMSIVGSDIGATDFIAVAGGTYRFGLAQANFDWLGSYYADDVSLTFANAPTITGRDAMLDQMTTLLGKVKSLAHPLTDASANATPIRSCPWRVCRARG